MTFGATMIVLAIFCGVLVTALIIFKRNKE